MRPGLPLIFCAGALLLLSFHAVPAWADRSVTLDNPPVLPGETAAQCYGDAIADLNRGVWFERSIAQLTEAVRQDPDNSDYHLALGCACADRAVSIGYAEAYTEDFEQSKADYAQSLADWLKAQNDPKSSDYGSPKPEMPVFVAYTKDDGKTLTLTKEQAVSRMEQLGHQALAEWKTAAALATNPADRASAEYVQGWGIELLANYGPKSVYVGGGKSSLPDYPGAMDSLPSFRAAVGDDPKNAIYWESLGDLLSNDLDGSSADQQQEGIADLRQSLALKPRNSALWFRFYVAERGSDKAQAESDLRQGVQVDAGNALPKYLLAYIDFEKTAYRNNAANQPSDDLQAKYPGLAEADAKQRWSRDLASSLTDNDERLSEEALQQIEGANLAPSCYSPLYYPPVPKLLWAAWSYLGAGEFFMMYADLRELARDTTGYVTVAAINGDLPDSLRAGRDIITMGMKLMGDWSMDDKSRGDMTLLTELVGVAIVDIGYNNLIETVKDYGDPSMAYMLQSEYDDFRAQETAWQNLVRQIASDPFRNY